ncbi:hypothetical protein [Acinetobacter venetianus]|uniref:hypothetical protein n=1 Tax=Acinetobacter venetianus TaxID=52133 RepID=UPI003A9331B1
MQATLQPFNSPAQKIDYTDPSVWGRLAEIFKSKFVLCDKDGNSLGSSLQVVAVPIEGQLSNEANWATPFDSSNPENKLPTLLGGLQSGTMSDLAGTLATKLGMGDSLAENLQKAEGRSSFTKVNSTQIFLSNSSVQISLTLLFRAWRNAKIEVENQVGLLHQMSVPIELSDDSIAAGQIENPSLSFDGFMPSRIPPYITLYYANRSYTPLILQSFSRDIVGNMTEHGDMVYLEVPITLLSRQAWDSVNVGRLYGLPGLN